MAATDPAAVISLFISAAHALDHHQTLGVDHPFFSFGDSLSQLQLGQYPVIFPIKVLGGLVFLGTGGDDRYAVTYLLDHPPGLHLGGEIAHVTGNAGDGRIGRDMKRGVPVDLAYEIIHVCLNIQPFKGEMNPPSHSSQLRILFHQVHLESLVGQAQGTGHPGHASADHQRPLVDRQLKFL